jgi:trimeric autotransporter adhesin
MKRIRNVFLAILGWTILGVSLAFGQAYEGTSPALSSNAVPHLIRFGGVATDAQGQPLSGLIRMTFGLYKDESGGSPLWWETQNLQADTGGRYTVHLGDATADGLPTELFVSGEARWLGVQVEGQNERPRVLLLSVPYALKAGDAETIGGLPPSAFTLAAPPNSSNSSQAHNAPLQGAGTLPNPTVGGIGTQNYIPIWTDNSGTLGNSTIYETNNKVGIGMTAPAFALDVKGIGNFSKGLTLPALGQANASAGMNSAPEIQVTSSFNSSTAKAVNQSFRWQAEPVGNNTPNPSGKLNLLFGSAGSPPAETGLSVASNGRITFASGQTFPGTGTITAVNAGTDLTGGGISGSVTLNLDTSKVPQLNSANSFVGNQSVTGQVSATGSVSGAAASFVGSNATQIGHVTQTGTGIGLLIQQNDTGTGPDVAIFASTTGQHGTAIEAQATNANSGASGIGVSGAAFGPIGVGIYGSANNANGGTGVTGYAASSTLGVGVKAVATSTSGIAAVLDNLGGGEILSARHNGVEVFSVDGSGNMQANGNITTQGGQAIIRSAAVPGIFNNSGGGTILIGQNNGTQKFSFDGSGNLATSGSVSATFFSGNGAGLTGIPALGGNNTFSGTNTFTNNQVVDGSLSVGTGNSSVITQTFGKDTGGTGIQNVTTNASTSGNSFAVVAATSSAGVTAELVADGLGTGPMGTPGGYYGTFTAHPLGFITNNIERMDIDTLGNVSVPAGSLTVKGDSSASNFAIFAQGPGSGQGWAGIFNGDVSISGTLSKSGGSFKIDHPLDPANKYLYHSFVESPDMMNIYNANVTLDRQGEAVITLPEWFETLNRDFRYQLTCIGGFAPVYVAEEVQNNTFRIAGGKPGMKVSWQVTGIRQDAWANTHRIPVEQAKPDRERGYYIHPELYGAPEEKGIEWARHPEIMKRVRETRQSQSAKSQTFQEQP